MRTTIYRLLITIHVLLASASMIFAQGSLAPPGAPAPTMKSLDQIEARTPISTLPFTISTSGSYYLTKNLSVTTGDAITISVNNVTLDLNGFTLSSSASPAGGTAIAPNGSLTDITILNGHIVGSFQHGIRYTGALGFLKNVRIEGISVSGCSADGINFGVIASSVVIDRCTVQQAGVQGIIGGTVNNSVAENCGSVGITARSVTNSVGRCSAGERGIYAKTALNCVGESATGTGLEADTATGCWGQSTALSSTGIGLSALTANGCYGYNTNGSGTGLSAANANGCYGSGIAGTGLEAYNASNCHGNSSSHTGLYATLAFNCDGNSESSYGLGAYSASFCRGISSTTAGVNTYIAIGCNGSGTSAVNAAYKYLSPF
jgi:hypothetical protein